MRYLGWALFLTITCSTSLPAQTLPPEPQSARQALIEMFMGKGADDFTKHLPDDARLALIRKGETPENSTVLRISAFGRGIAAQGKETQTFDVGPNILVSERPDQHERLEIAVEHDSFTGEGDEIELSVHYYKDGQEVSLPVVPRVIFTMKQEKDIWRLTEATIAAHIPLTDPDYLKGLRKEQDEANERAAQMRAGMLVTAETGYAASHPERGYTCTLPRLVAEGAYDPGQGNEDWSGYHFALSGCEGSPVSKYRLTAVPSDPSSEGKTFCADETGKLRSMTGGPASSCFSQGQPLSSSEMNAQVE